MTFTLDHAQVYDVESFPNVFTLTAEALYSDQRFVWEISQYRDDRRELIEWFNYLNAFQIPMIGFFSENYDYPMIHFIYTNPSCTVEQIYAKSQSIISSVDRFGHIIWARDRFAPQIDLAKVHHFDNKAKTTTLKALQINMRAPNVMESPIPFGQPVSAADVDAAVIPYNGNDVAETKRFAHISMGALNFRIGLIDQFGVEVLNYNDTKIGEKMLEQRLGDDVCFTRVDGRRQKRQTVRSRIALKDIIFPYIRFNNPEFQRVHRFMLDQVLTPDDLDDPEAVIKTKGVFTNLTADVGGLTFYFGTGGVHASVEAQRFIATDEWPIRDIDVEGLYPRIAIVNRLAPEHLGEAYITEYAKIPAERKLHAKGTYQNAALKLAANGSWGKSNNKFSVFYDPLYAMQIPINGQLMICMLAEWLLTVPTVTLIQANTDGITYRVRRDHMDAAKAIEQQWQDYTQLKLEDASYSRMWIRDVNNYVAESTYPRVHNRHHGTAPADAVYCGRGTPYGNPFKDGTRDENCDRFEREVLPTLDVSALKGKDLICSCAPKRCHCDSILREANGPRSLKQKGAYWHPDPRNYNESISLASPPCWYKDLGNIVSVRAALAAMVHGIDPETYIRAHSDPFDFMLRIKVDRSSLLYLGDKPIQRTTRYYVTTDGLPMVKLSPPPAGCQLGAFKRKNGVHAAEYERVMCETGGQWDERVCTGNRSKYEERRTAIQAGWRVSECNVASAFRFANVDYSYYIAEAKKLIIS